MIGIDTNVLVRYLVNDDENQAEVAATLIDSYEGQQNSIYINNIVICELVWVLSKGYKYSKESIGPLLREILSTTEFSFYDARLLLLCLFEYEKSKSDFADILISKLNNKAGCSTTYTFDQKASTLANFSNLIK